MTTEHSHKDFKTCAFDHATGRASVTFNDGSVVPLGPSPELVVDNTLVAMTVFDWETWWIGTTTVRQDLILTEGYNPHSPPALRGRPTVYLDQNKWRVISDAQRHPDRAATSREHQAALDLVDLVNDGKIVLLLSEGHLLETSRLHGDLRYEVGVTMAGLTRGWQLRHPLDLWKHEATSSIRSLLSLNPDPSPRYAITTEPGALFDSNTNLSLGNDATDFDRFLAMLDMPAVILDRLIDPEADVRAPLQRWIDTHQRINSQIREAAAEQNLNKQQTLRLARRRYWNENIKFYRDPYQQATGRPDFPTFGDRELTVLLDEQPMVGLLSNVFIHRFVNRDTRWKANDLIDMLYLSAAAGYADYTCAERHTGTQLRGIQRSLARTENVYTDLATMLQDMRSRGFADEPEW